ncbi:glycosyltransferase family 2 protein [Thiomonas delicata]|nr:glycosyltransferase family A protein [Thiomonas delicata]
MKFSVIIPTRNRSHILKVALDSVLRQDFSDFEVLIVDDASESEHQRINADIALAAGVKVTYLLLQQGSGGAHGLPAVSRNAGIAAANGELLAFLDDDDHWSDPEYLSRAAQAFKLCPDLEFLFADQQAWFNGQCVREHWQPNLRLRLRGRTQVGEELYELSRADCLAVDVVTTQMNVCVFRHDFLQRLGGFNPKLGYGEDMDMYVRAADAANKIYFLDRVVAIHNRPDRQKNLNMSSLAGMHKMLIGMAIANDLMCVCRTPEAWRYARHWAATDSRDLARFAEEVWGPGRALTWAAVALAYRFTLKWFIYVGFLFVRGLVYRDKAIRQN